MSVPATHVFTSHMVVIVYGCLCQIRVSTPDADILELEAYPFHSREDVQQTYVSVLGRMHGETSVRANGNPALATPRARLCLLVI